MNRTFPTFTLLLAFLALSLGAVAAGLWVTRPPDLSLQVAALEAKVREDEAVITRLRRQTSSTVSSPHFSDSSAIQPSVVGVPADALSTTDSQPRAPGAADNAPIQSQEQPSGTRTGPGTGPAPVVATDTAALIKSDKRLAEAEAHYAGLIHQLGLQPDEKEAFKDMAAQRDDIRKATFSALSDPSLTPGQRQAILTDAKRQVGQVDDSVRHFLNNDADYQTYQNWESQNIEREQMDTARTIFEQNGVPLSSDQESTLVDQMWARRTSGQGLGDPYSADTLAGQRIDQNYISGSLAKYDVDTGLLLQQAGRYMNPQQVQSYKAARFQQRVQLESRLWGMARTTSR